MGLSSATSRILANVEVQTTSGCWVHCLRFTRTAWLHLLLPLLLDQLQSVSLGILPALCLLCVGASQQVVLSSAL